MMSLCEQNGDNDVHLHSLALVLKAFPHNPLSFSSIGIELPFEILVKMGGTKRMSAEEKRKVILR